MAKREDLTGRRFGRWEVLRASDRHRHWVCRCDCGTEKPVFSGSLKNGHSPSCGCLTRSVFAARWLKHGHGKQGVERSREYETWARVISRCENERNPAFKDYGGRGIAMCKRWREDFSNFLADMGPRPGPAYSIERLKVDGNYEPGNCVWATIQRQARNRRNNRHITALGETMTLVEWSERTGIKAVNISRRIAAGMPAEQALTQPTRQRVAFH